MGKNPFRYGAACSKDELLRSIKRQSSNIDTRASLAASRDSQLPKRNLSGDVRTRNEILTLLHESEAYLSRDSSNSSPVGIQRKDSCGPDDLDTCSLIDHTCNKSYAMIDETYNTFDETFIAYDKKAISTQDQFTSPAFASTIWKTTDARTTFCFDLRQPAGTHGFQRWQDQNPSLASSVQKLIVKHWTWVLDAVDSQWAAIEDETVFSLRPSGNIKVHRPKSANLNLCQCDAKSGKSSRSDEQPWSMTDFAQALAQNDSQLIQVASKFVELIADHDETYEPVPCKKCKEALFYLRIYRERTMHPDLVPEPLRLSSTSPPPIPPKSVLRTSRSFSSDMSGSSYEIADSGFASISKELECHQDTYDILNTADQDRNPTVTPTSSTAICVPNPKLMIPDRPSTGRFTEEFSPPSSVRGFRYEDFADEAEDTFPTSAASEQSHGFASPAFPMSSAADPPSTTRSSQSLAGRFSQRVSRLFIRP